MCGSRFGFHAIWLCRLQTLHNKLKRYIDDIVYQLDYLNFVFNKMIHSSPAYLRGEKLGDLDGSPQDFRILCLWIIYFVTSLLFGLLGSCARARVFGYAGGSLIYFSKQMV
jgi:hypothetical protein